MIGKNVEAPANSFDRRKFIWITNSFYHHDYTIKGNEIKIQETFREGKKFVF